MPLPNRIRYERQARHDRRIAAAAQIVPHGPYCYSHTGNMRLIERQGQTFSVPERKPCPYLKLRQDRPRQQNGYCRLLKAGDYSQGPHRTMLLWDSCKECGINLDDPQDPAPAGGSESSGL